MVSVTYRETAPARDVSPKSPKRKNILRVIFEVMLEARQLQAEMEMRRHRHLLPLHVEQARRSDAK